MRAAMVALVVSMFSPAMLSAQDDVLAVEKREDLLGRDRLARVLLSQRTDLQAEAMTPKDMCKLLTTLAGGKATFLFAAKGEAAATPAFDLELKSASLLTAMAAVQLRTGLRFVYRDGMVFLVGKDELRPLTYVLIYDLRAAVVPLKNFPGPRLGLDHPKQSEGSGTYPAEEDSGTTVSGFTAESITTLIKENVTPELWAGDKVSLSDAHGLFVIRQTIDGHRRIRVLLDELGLMALPRVVVREVP